MVENFLGDPELLKQDVRKCDPDSVSRSSGRHCLSQQMIARKPEQAVDLDFATSSVQPG